MFHLKLVKALSYSGVVEATKKKPDVFVEDQAIANKAVATGYFQIIEDDEGLEVTPEEKPGKTLEEMTMAELETYAAYHNVSLKGIRVKAAAVEKIKETLGLEETENEVDYGSPTMQELQDEM